MEKQIITGTNGEEQLKGIELKQMEAERRSATAFEELQKEILKSLLDFLEERFEADDNFVKMIEPLLRFDETINIGAIYAAIVPDLNLPNLSLQFQDIASDPKIYENLSLTQLIAKLCKTVGNRIFFKDIITLLSRITACTPHSADVERTISASHRLKSKLRSSITVETENRNLFIHYNMPDLAAKVFFNEKARQIKDFYI